MKKNFNQGFADYKEQLDEYLDEKLPSKYEIQKIIKRIGDPVYAIKDELYKGEIDSGKVAVLIPAYNEEATVADVIRVAKQINPGRLIVIDNNSRDKTAAVAKGAGAEVVPCENQGKAEAMLRGVQAVDESTPVIMFLDADLTNLKKEHLKALLVPFFQEKELPNLMSMGTFYRGEKGTEFFWYNLPFLTGQRALLRSEFLKTLQGLEVKNWEIEATLNAHFRDKKLPVKPMILDGVFHITKDEKHKTPVRGHYERVRMLAIAIVGYIKFPFRKLWRILKG